MLKIFVLTVLLAGVNCRYLLVEEQPLHFAEDGVFVGGAEYFNDPLEMDQLKRLYTSRVRRQAQTTIKIDGMTGNPELSAKVPVARSDSNVLSVVGSQSPASRSVGLVVDNVNGHVLGVSQKTIPEFGKQLNAAGKLNLLHTDKHDISANAFVAKTIPKFAEVPNFNTYGGGVDYTFNNKVGASLGARRTDFLQRTDVDALGHLNLFRNKDTSFDFSAGASRSFSPFSRSSWEPTFDFSLTKSW